MAERLRLDVKHRALLLKAREAEGLKAFKKLQRLLTKSDVDNIERSMRVFRAKFKLG